MAGYGELQGGSFSSGYRNTGKAPSASSGMNQTAAGIGLSVATGGISNLVALKGFSDLPSEAKKGAATGAVGGTLSGAATGAAIGSVIPVIGTAAGAVVGGIVGFVGGLFSGGLSGGKKAKEKYYKKLAAQVQQQRESNSTYNQYLQMIRQTRIANAQSVATAATSGLEYSSAFYGAAGGLKSQSIYSVQYLAEDRRLQELYAKYMRKAGKSASIANDIEAGWDAIQSLSQSAVHIGGSYKKLYGSNYPSIPRRGYITQIYNDSYTDSSIPKLGSLY